MMLYLAFIIVLALALIVLLTPLLRANELPLGKRQTFAACVAMLFFFGAFGLYHAVGSPQILPLMKQRDAKLAELRQVIIQRSDEVKANPKNAGAWVELGHSFMETGQYDAAANAFRQAVLLTGGNPTLILDYARAQIAQADGKVTDDAKKGLQMVVLQQPKNEEARYWLIVRQLQDGDTQNAMKAMKALYHSLPEDSPVRALIDQQIGRK